MCKLLFNLIKKENPNWWTPELVEDLIQATKEAFEAEFAIVKAWKGDTEGNLIFKATARNFNPMMATAGKITIAEVEELVPAGELNPNDIHTPGIFVQRIFKGEKFEKRIEQRTTQAKK